MPSANKTSLGLNQWQANEYPKMADFNEDNRIIDEKITELQSGSGVKIYTTTELSEPQEGKIYNVKITQNTSVINGKSVYKENTTQSVTLKAGKVATVYFSGGNFFYKASASGNAVAENVLAGKKFSNDDGTDITGTMKDNGRKIIRPSTSNIIIPKGFHDGTGYVEGDSDLAASNIVQGKNIFGVSGQALQYQQSEKDAIANALTSKGVPTSTTASWATIEQNIRGIKSGLEKVTPVKIRFKFSSSYGMPIENNFYKITPTGIYKADDYHFSNKLNLKKGSIIFHLSQEEPYSYMASGFLLSECRGVTPIMTGGFLDYYLNHFSETSSVRVESRNTDNGFFQLSAFLVDEDNPKIVLQARCYNGEVSMFRYVTWILFA